jgi:predicted AlkP superfamily pyrophosphatase or phosphodiesterase
MATVAPTNRVALSQYFDQSKTERVVWGGQVTQIYPKAGEEEVVARALTAAPPGGHVRCYRKADIPARFHYNRGSRIAPVVCLADEGWVISSRTAVESENVKPAQRSTGAHGYDNELESMRATFIAHGAAFKKRAVIEAFPNVNVYHIMTEILNLKPAPNDGSVETARAVLRSVK